jgi:hypothetical protein
VHAVEDRDAAIDVVVEFDVVLAFVGAQQPADALHDATLEREREREEQGVELGPVEPFTEVGAGGHEDDPLVGVAGRDRIGTSFPGARAETAAQDERIVAERCKGGDDGIDVIGPLGERFDPCRADANAAAPCQSPDHDLRR